MGRGLVTMLRKNGGCDGIALVGFLPCYRCGKLLSALSVGGCFRGASSSTKLQGSFYYNKTSF